VAAGYALAIAGVGPFCVVEIHSELLVSQRAVAMCGRRVLVCDRFGGLFVWIPSEDEVCADCVDAVRVVVNHRLHP
jgi:hypothetical protein